MKLVYLMKIEGNDFSGCDYQYVMSLIKTKNPNAFPIGNKFGFFMYGGPEETRTLDLSDANRTLSQLSYRPIFFVALGYYSIILKIVKG